MNKNQNTYMLKSKVKDILQNSAIELNEVIYLKVPANAAQSLWNTVDGFYCAAYCCCCYVVQ